MSEKKKEDKKTRRIIEKREISGVERRRARDTYELSGVERRTTKKKKEKEK